MTTIMLCVKSLVNIPKRDKNMRYPAAETAEKHTRILNEASRLFRQRGFTGVGVSEIMKATGLTHGPFYNHFESKDALMRESIEHASAAALADMAIAASSPQDMVAFVEGYLGEAHRDAPGQGCLMAALAGEVAREPGLQPAFTQHFTATIDRLAKSLPWPAKRASRDDAIRLMSAMVGAIVLSRAVDDKALSREILQAVRQDVPAATPI